MPTESAEAADSPRLADRAAGEWAVYVHVPFCRRACPYCDFAVVAGREELAGRYVAAVGREVGAAEPFPGPVAAVAFGGGTPTRLPANDLGLILAAIRDRFGLQLGAEASLEANPEDWSPGLAAELVGCGFDRVSMGVQSFDPGVLAALGRAHEPRQAEEALAVARSAGFRSVGADLIFGTPGESERSWRASVERALAAGIDHLSAYALTVERGTPLSRAITAGAPGPDADEQAERYEAARELAAGAGLAAYETSNFARAGHACRYNLITWAGGDYEGCGPGAHRHRRGRRSWNVRRLERYLERVEAGRSPAAGAESLGPWPAEQERLVLGLRRAAGVAAASARPLTESPAGRRLLAAGVLEEQGGRVRVARPFLGNEVARAVLALPPPDC